MTNIPRADNGTDAQQPTAVARHLIKGGSAALVIKLAAAGLAYLMFVVPARLMSEAEYGRFGFAFSLATFLTLVAIFGQHTAILRFWPEFFGKGQVARAKGALVLGYKAVFIGSLLTIGVVAVAVLVVHILDQAAGASYLFAAGVLALPLALAEYQGSAMRAAGSVVFALLPREIVWRGGVIVIMLSLAATGTTLSAMSLLWICAGLLIILVAVQGGAFRHQISTRFSAVNASYDVPGWRSASLGFWALAILGILSQTSDVIVLGIFLTPEETGGYFLALKTASLLSLPLLAANVVAAPLMSQYFHADRLMDVQRICRLISATLAIPTLAAFLVLVLLGDVILAFVGTGYIDAYGVLIVLAVGFTVNTLCGTSASLLMMTGYEKNILKILLFVQIVMLAAQCILIPIFGPIGASIANAASQVAWNVWVRQFAVNVIGIDPTILSIFRRPNEPPVLCRFSKKYK